MWNGVQMRLNLTPPEFMALYSTLVKLDGQFDIRDGINVRNVVDRMHSCLISALLRKEEGDNREVTHVEITDKLFNKWEEDQKSKIESLKKATSLPAANSVDSGKTRSVTSTQEVASLPPLPSFLMLDDHELVEPGNQYPRKHRGTPPSPQLPKNRKWRGKHKK